MITQIGKHRVQHGNVMDGIDELMGDDRASFVYSDPPWGQGNLKYWQTMNFKATGMSRQDVDYAAFLDKLFGIFQTYCHGTLIIEYGQKWRADIIAIGERFGFQHGSTIEGFYSQTYKLDYHIFTPVGRAMVFFDDEDRQAAETVSGYKIVKYFFTKYAPDDGIVLDPMCGMGYSAQGAIDCDLAFRGNELNEKRLEKTITRLKLDLL